MAVDPSSRARALKYVSVSRNQFSKEQFVELIPLLIEHLHSPNVVVHSFSGYMLKGRREFSTLFSIVDNAQQNENEYVMKAIMRSLGTAIRRKDVVPVTQTIIEKLRAVLVRVARNQRNPQFTHYLLSLSLSSSKLFVRGIRGLHPPSRCRCLTHSPPF